MVHLYIYSLLAGLIGANGVPHFVKGITGEMHQTPFGRQSAATVNVAWGWVNFVAAMLLLHFAHPRAHELRSFALLALGALATALLLAATWSKTPRSGR